jgi:hypothetical protein
MYVRERIEKGEGEVLFFIKGSHTLHQQKNKTQKLTKLTKLTIIQRRQEDVLQEE